MPVYRRENPYEEIDMGNGEQVRVTHASDSWSGQGGIRIQIRDEKGHLRPGPEIPVDLVADVVRSVIKATVKPRLSGRGYKVHPGCFVALCAD